MDDASSGAKQYLAQLRESADRRQSNVVIIGWSDRAARVVSVTDSSNNVYQLAVGPTVSTGPFGLTQRFPTNDGSFGALINDTDHAFFWTDIQAGGASGQRDFVWKNFTLGNSALFMDPYLLSWPQRNSPTGCSGGQCTVVDPQYDDLRRNMGYMLDYANNKLDLVHMTPKGSLCSTGYCLAKASASAAEYLV